MENWAQWGQHQNRAPAGSAFLIGKSSSKPILHLPPILSWPDLIKHYIICKYILSTIIHFFCDENLSPASRAAHSSVSRRLIDDVIY